MFQITAFYIMQDANRLQIQQTPLKNLHPDERKDVTELTEK